MVDKYLREQLIRSGIINKDLWCDKDSFTELDKMRKWYTYSYNKERNDVIDLRSKLDALLRHLNIEEVYVPEQNSTYMFKKIANKKQ